MQVSLAAYCTRVILLIFCLGSYCTTPASNPIQCGLGNYCPQGSSAAIPCPAGTFGSTPALSTASCTGLCAADHWCPQGSQAATQNACPANSASAPGSTNQSACECRA